MDIAHSVEGPWSSPDLSWSLALTFHLKQVAFIAHSPPTQQAAPFAQQLGLEMTPMGDIATSGPFGATSMPDVFAAGDAAVMGKAIPVAMGTGASAGAGVANDLAYGDLGLNMAEIMQQVMSVMAKK